MNNQKIYVIIIIIIIISQNEIKQEQKKKVLMLIWDIKEKITFSLNLKKFLIYWTKRIIIKITIKKIQLNEYRIKSWKDILLLIKTIMHFH